MVSFLRALRAAILGTALVIIGAICLSGTLMIDSDPPFILQRLRLASFTGIVSDPGTSSPAKYLITMHWFLNALDFTYPLAPKEYQTAGMMYNIDGLVPGDSLTLPAHLIAAARQVALPDDAWRCLPDHPSGDASKEVLVLPMICTEAFFEAWAARHRAAEFTFRTDWALYAYYAAAVFLWAKTARGLGVAVGLLTFSATSTSWLVSDAVGRLRAVEGVEVEANRGFATASWGLVGLGVVLWCMAVSRERSQGDDEAGSGAEKRDRGDQVPRKDDVKSRGVLSRVSCVVE